MKNVNGQKKRFNELSIDINNGFGSKLLTVAIISEVDDIEVRNLFVRLQKGKPLTDQQIRDTSVSGINDFVLKIGGKNDLLNNSRFNIKLEGVDISPNGHQIFNEVLKTSRTDRGQTRQLVSQLVMLYLEMIENNKAVSTKTKNISDFYIRNLDFSPDSKEAKDFENILDDLYEILEPNIRLANYELIHLFLFLKRIRDLGIKNYREKFLFAFIQFRNKLKESKETQKGVYWTEFGIRVSTDSNNGLTISRRHNFFVEKMMEFMFGDIKLSSIELDSVFVLDEIVANNEAKLIVKAFHGLINSVNESSFIHINNILLRKYTNFNNGLTVTKSLQNNIVNKSIVNLPEANQAVISINELIEFINECIQQDSNFILEFQRRTTKSKHRSLVNRDRNKLYTRSPHLINDSCELKNNWWIVTNNSKKQNTNFYNIARDLINELKGKS